MFPENYQYHVTNKQEIFVVFFAFFSLICLLLIGLLYLVSPVIDWLLG